MDSKKDLNQSEILEKILTDKTKELVIKVVDKEITEEEFFGEVREMLRKYHRKI